MHLETPSTGHLPIQQTTIIPSFTLDSGCTLRNVPVAYTTRGKLSASRDNAIVICHALTGSADMGDWWKQMFSYDIKALDDDKFFIICMNVLGSPYGTASPVTAIDGDPTKGLYGPDFPTTTVSDDVRLHKLVLDHLGVEQIAAVIGGSMGGMHVMEYAYLGKNYVRSIVPIASSAMQSAWAIGWSESQRQMIYSDEKYRGGYYPLDSPPIAGLGSARMAAMLTYRSPPSFHTRFGRRIMNEKQVGCQRVFSIPKNIKDRRPSLDRVDSHESLSTAAQIKDIEGYPYSETSPDMQEDKPLNQSPLELRRQIVRSSPPEKPYYAIQSYLRYQADKFVRRFDANCYIALTEKIDSHDVSKYSLLRGRAVSEDDHMRSALSLVSQPTLVMGIESDGLYTFDEQLALASGIPNSTFARIDGPEGHDAFLIHCDQVNYYLLKFFREVMPDIMLEI